MRGVRRGSVRLAASIATFVSSGLLLFAPPASATFHLIKVREVYPAGQASYVMLQLLAAGEYQVHGHRLMTYNADGTLADEFFLPSDVNPTSRANAAILVAGSGYESAFPDGPTGLVPDELDANMNLSPEGGAVCWLEGEPPDCVAWGDFTGPLPAHSPPLVVGNPASPGGVTPGKALRRSIAGGECANFLEMIDDTDDSATNFSEQEPHPRDNGDPVEEKGCVVPDVSFTSKPKNPTNSTSALFTYESLPLGADFECQLDWGGYLPCGNEGYEIPGPLADGSHTFQVRGGETGEPATWIWIVDTQPPTAAITGQPANPSPGASAAFTYTASQLGSTFECSLAKVGEGESFASCPATGNTYTNLGDGIYTFEVRATDKAGNLGAPAAYTWEVNNALGIITPPPVVPPPAPAPAPKPLHCKKGFVKKKVKGKKRCVKKKRHRRKRH